MKFKSLIKESYAIIGLWVVLFFTLWLQVLPQTHSVSEATLFVFCVLAVAFPFTKYLSETLLQKAMKKKKATAFISQFILLSVIIGVLFTAFLFLFSYIEQEGIFPPSEYFNMDIPASMLLVPLSAGILINACVCGVRFFEENLKLKKTLLEYQLRTLKHQITPHFMFNVLNHIHTLMQTDVELASDLLIKYSEILRYQLYNDDKQNVTLEQDVQFLKDFIEIEKIRWSDKLTVTCSWEMENPQLKIPALLFITFIENAFKHVSKSDFEKGYININFKQKDNIIRLDVENSKSALFGLKKKDACRLGLKNIKARLEILYFERYTLSVEETDTAYRTKLLINT